MRPDTETTNAFLYCLAVAANKAGIKVVFFLAMSNHYHAGIIDAEGRLPEFLERFHKLFAKHQNTLRGRWENFWATEQTSVVELVGPDDVLHKMVYALGNPVKDHLVHGAHQWPGATSFGAHLHGHRLHARRPSRFFRRNGPMPERVELELAKPPGFESMPHAEFTALLRERLLAVTQAAVAERAQTGGTVLGRKGVLQQRWSDQPKTIEPRRQMSPRVACKNTWRRIETLRRNRSFIAAYRAARALLLSGGEAVFPMGTYWLRRFACAACAPGPATS